MRAVLVALALGAILPLAACVSLLDGVYNEQARRECDRQSRDRGACYDRIDQHRRDRDRDH